MSARRFAGAALFAIAACGSPGERVTVRLELPAELATSSAKLRVLPAIAEARRKPGRGVIALELKRAAGKVTLELPGACPVTLDTRALATGEVTTRALEPLFDVGPSVRVVGLAQSFEIVAKPRCAAAASVKTSFEVRGGASLIEPTSSARSFAAKTPDASALPARHHGIVPVSARARQQLTSELAFRVDVGDQAFEQKLEISAVARSNGLPNVGLSHPIVLSADSWRLFDQPVDSRTQLRSLGAGLSELEPDLPGRYRLVDALGRELSIQSGRFDRMPLDCGRADCHREIAESAQNSPMTQVLASDLGGCHSLTDASCATACHTTGEPGTADGGFSHVAAELGVSVLPLEHDDLARDLQRLGGVGCMACHGPAAIPEPSARFNVLRTDVCAVCHDAPPRYQHVQALAGSRMGHADGNPLTREGECARCHTSWGALGRPAPPAHAQGEGFGITCSTCHDVHPRAQVAPLPTTTHGGLLRSFALPASLPSPPESFSGVSRVCIACHAPSSESGLPAASAALIVAGQGARDPRGLAALTLPSPHAQDAKGCLACHQNVEGGVLGKGHDFRATDATCERCHREPPRRRPEIAGRAKSLLERLEPSLARMTGGAWHAQATPLPSDRARAEALRNVLLVLEDPAADVHHPRYANALLDAAEAVTGARP